MTPQVSVSKLLASMFIQHNTCNNAHTNLIFEYNKSPNTGGGNFLLYYRSCSADECNIGTDRNLLTGHNAYSYDK